MTLHKRGDSGYKLGKGCSESNYRKTDNRFGEIKLVCNKCTAVNKKVCAYCDNKCAYYDKDNVLDKGSALFGLLVCYLSS